MVRNIYVCNYLQRVRIGFAALLKYMYTNISYFYSPTKNTCHTHTYIYIYIYTYVCACARTHVHTHIPDQRTKTRDTDALCIYDCLTKIL